MALQEEFTWCDKDGANYCTEKRDQHIPLCCGSCRSHGSLSVFADRNNLVGRERRSDINPSVLQRPNCGGGCCHGGSVDGPYQFMKRVCTRGRKRDSVRTPLNVARTWSSFDHEGDSCGALMCTRDLRSEVMQPYGKTVKKVINEAWTLLRTVSPTCKYHQREILWSKRKPR